MRRARQIDPHARRGYGASRVQLHLQLLVAAVLPEADLEAARNVHAGAQLGLRYAQLGRRPTKRAGSTQSSEFPGIWSKKNS